MNPYVRDRIHRKLDTLSDERLYQILDYVEFLESKYAEKSAPVANVFTRFAEGVEDQLRAGGHAHRQRRAGLDDARILVDLHPVGDERLGGVGDHDD